MSPSKAVSGKGTHRDQEMIESEETIGFGDPASRVATARHQLQNFPPTSEFPPKRMIGTEVDLGLENPTSRLAAARHQIEFHLPKNMSEIKDEDELDLNDPASRLEEVRHQRFEGRNMISKYKEKTDMETVTPFSFYSPVATWSRPGTQHCKDEDEEGKSVPSTPIHQLGQYKGVNISIEVSDTFAFESPQIMKLALEGQLGYDDGTYIYSRCCNPTVLYLGKYLAALENTESAYCTSSGMSAITATMIHLCKTGGHVVASNQVYGGTTYLLKTFLHEKCNVTTTFVDITDHVEVENAIVEGKTNVLYFETVSNPALIVADIPALCKIAHDKGVKVVVDNTFTPMIFTPANYGADVVLHSMTKYVSGGSDIIAGAVCGSTNLVKAMTKVEGGTLMMLGPTMNPKEAFELLERMSHMSMRVQEQCTRAMELAVRMKTELRINVNYPGLLDHPQHELFTCMMNKGYGYGAMLCIDVGTTERAFDLLTKLKNNNFGLLAVSLGYYENLLSCPGALVKNPPKERKKQSDITPGYIRMSIGHIGTLKKKWNQFKRAYTKLEC